MNISRARSVVLLPIAFALILAWSSPVPAGQFYITSFNYVVVSDYDDSVLIGSKSRAKYMGTLDSNDHQWQIGAGVRPAGGSWHNGSPNNGGNITAGKVIDCFANSCGGNASVNKCTPANTNNAFTYRGEVAILHSNGNDADGGVDIGHLVCDPPGGDDDPPHDPVEEEENDPPHTPILIDVDRNHYQLAGVSDAVYFDIDGDGQEETLSWTEANSEDAFLALDRNGNGVIDSGRELFGNVTEQPPSQSPNGFEALAVLDRAEYGGDADGEISHEDAAFYLLLLWTDRNHDGYSQSNEIEPLSTSAIEAIELSYVENGQADQHGNQFRWKSKVHFQQGQRFAAVDVIFVAGE